MSSLRNTSTILTIILAVMVIPTYPMKLTIANMHIVNAYTMALCADGKRPRMFLTPCEMVK